MTTRRRKPALTLPQAHGLGLINRRTVTAHDVRMIRLKAMQQQLKPGLLRKFVDCLKAGTLELTPVVLREYGSAKDIARDLSALSR